jgi:dGTPase
LRAGLIALPDLEVQPLIGPAVAAAQSGRANDDDEGRRVHEITRRMITVTIADLVGETRSRLAMLSPKSPDDVRQARSATAAFTETMAADIARLKGFLLQRVYRHERVMRVMRDAEGIVHDLFGRYLGETSAMPATWYAASRGLSERRLARLIADFVAGMTDRYAIGEHRRLFDVTPNLR